MTIRIAGTKRDVDTIQTNIWVDPQTGPEIRRDRRSFCNIRAVKRIAAAVGIVPSISEHISPVAESQVVTCQQFAVLAGIR